MMFYKLHMGCYSSRLPTLDLVPRSKHETARDTLNGDDLHALSGPGVRVCKSCYNIVIWRAENRTHLSKKTRPSTERCRRTSNVRGIPSRPDDQLRWVLIIRTQVHD